VTEQGTSTKRARLVLGPATPGVAHDADTFRVSLDMGALIPGAKFWEEDVRLAHVDAPELSTQAGRDARDAVSIWLAAHTPGTLTVYGRDKYGRLLADYSALSGDTLSAFVARLDGSRPIDLRAQLAR
jgi:endonuclease YncB( thermonuclease family)